MPIISKFFGIVIRMFYDEHNPLLRYCRIQKFSGMQKLREEL